MGIGRSLALGGYAAREADNNEIRGQGMAVNNIAMAQQLQAMQDAENARNAGKAVAATYGDYGSQGAPPPVAQGTFGPGAVAPAAGPAPTQASAPAPVAPAPVAAAANKRVQPVASKPAQQAVLSSMQTQQGTMPGSFYSTGNPNNGNTIAGDVLAGYDQAAAPMIEKLRRGMTLSPDEQQIVGNAPSTPPNIRSMMRFTPISNGGTVSGVSSTPRQAQLSPATQSAPVIPQAAPAPAPAAMPQVQPQGPIASPIPNAAPAPGAAPQSPSPFGGTSYSAQTAPIMEQVRMHDMQMQQIARQIEALRPYAGNPQVDAQLAQLQSGAMQAFLGRSQVITSAALQGFSTTGDPTQLVQVMNAQGIPLSIGRTQDGNYTLLDTNGQPIPGMYGSLRDMATHLSQQYNQALASKYAEHQAKLEEIAATNAGAANVAGINQAGHLAGSQIGANATVQAAQIGADKGQLVADPVNGGFIYKQGGQLSAVSPATKANVEGVQVTTPPQMTPIQGLPNAGLRYDRNTVH